MGERRGQYDSTQLWTTIKNLVLVSDGFNDKITVPIT
jgi:hypothetical protein